jgi:hypothetical protein
MNRRTFFASVLPIAAVPTAAVAQIMPDNGIDFGFFRSAQEKRARAACEQNLPECRADVRRQMQTEKGYSLLTPWILLGLGILGVLLYARKREKAKEEQRKLARRKHVPGQFKGLDKTGDQRTAADQY